MEKPSDAGVLPTDTIGDIAHQGLLAGNRKAGYGTLKVHLDHEQMKEWYAFDEGGKSGSGGWGRVRTHGTAA